MIGILYMINIDRTYSHSTCVVHPRATTLLKHSKERQRVFYR